MVFNPLCGQPGPDSLLKVLENSKGKERALVLNALAVFYAPVQPEKSISYASDALAMAKKHRMKAQQAEAYRNLADSYFYLDNLNEAINYYSLSAGISLELWGPTSEEYIGRTGDIAYCYDMLNEYRTAYRYYLQNLENARAGGLKAEIAANLANIGRILTIWGDYGKAIEYMEQALQLDQEMGNPEILATDYNTIGKIFSKWGEYDKAIEYFKQALEINRKLRMPEKVSIRLNNIGETYLIMGKYDESMEFFIKALEIDRELGNETQQAVRYTNIARVYLKKEMPGKARAYIIQAESIFRDHHDKLNIVSALSVLGRIDFEEENYQSAISHLWDAYQKADEKNFRHQKVNLLELLSSAYEKTGDFKTAYLISQRHDSLEDLIFNEENARQMSAFQAKFEVEQERQKTALLAKDKRIQQKTLLIIIIILSAAMLLLGLSSIILRLRSISGRQQKELAISRADAFQKELELRNKELTLSAMNIIRSNESMMNMVDLMQSSVEEGNSSSKIQEALQSLRAMDHELNWEDFEMRFTQVYQEFYRKLDAEFPGLSPNERKLCAFLKMNMSTKEIASITRQSIKSINVARSRLRKKLGIDHSSENIIGFLSRL